MDVGKRSEDAEKQAKVIIEDPDSAVGMAEKAQQKVRKNQVKLGTVRRDFETLIRMLKAWGTGKYKGIGIANILVVAGAIFYFVNPFDAVVDFMPIIGFTDDVAVITFALARLKNEVQKFQDWEEVVDVPTSDPRSSDD